MNSHEEIVHKKYAPKSMKSHKEISQPPKRKSHKENPVRKCHAKIVQHKAWSRIRARQEKEAEFIHSQRKKKRRKNPDQNTVAGKEGKLTLHAKPTTISPSQQYYLSSPPHPQFLANSLSHPSTILKQPCLGKGPTAMKSHKDIS